MRELTQEDLELNADKENAQAKLLELQSGASATTDELSAELKKLKNSLDEIRAKGYKNSELERIDGEFVPEIKNLVLLCGLPEVF